jgi:hypothetical protein
LHSWYKVPKGADTAGPPYLKVRFDDDAELGSAVVRVLELSMGPAPEDFAPVDEALAHLSGLAKSAFWRSAHCCEMRVREGLFMVFAMKHTGRRHDALIGTGDVMDVPLDSPLRDKVEAVRRAIGLAEAWDVQRTTSSAGHRKD